MADDGLRCPEKRCQGLEPLKTQWEAADYWNRVHSTIQPRYRCPACQMAFATYQMACNHIRRFPTEEAHVQHQVHVQSGARWMMELQANPRYIAPQGHPLLPSEARRRRTVGEDGCWLKFKRLADQISPVLTRVPRPTTSRSPSDQGRSTSTTRDRRFDTSKDDRLASRDERKRKRDKEARNGKSQKRHGDDSPAPSRVASPSPEATPSPSGGNVPQVSKKGMPLCAQKWEQYPFETKKVAGEEAPDCRQVAQYNLPLRTRDYGLPGDIPPISQADLEADNPGAHWVVGTEICDTPVDADNLPVTSVKYHGVDPLGRPFMYVSMHNVSRRPGRRNEGGVDHTFPVLIRPRNRPAWNLTPRAFGRRSNWLQTRRQ